MLCDFWNLELRACSEPVFMNKIVFANLQEETMRYPSDLANKQWHAIRRHIQYGKYGNRSVHDKRELVNAVFCLLKIGCQ